MQQETSKSRACDKLGYALPMERDDFVMMVVRNLSAAMARKGTNASEVARRAGLNPTAVYDIISGKSRSPKLGTVNRIADAIGVQLASLLSDPQDDELDQELIEAIPGDGPRPAFLACRRRISLSNASFSARVSAATKP